MWSSQDIDVIIVLLSDYGLSILHKSEVEFLTPGTTEIGQKVLVYQYLCIETGWKQCVGYGTIKNMEKNKIYYKIESNPGGLGSPIINGEGMIVGIHKAEASDSGTRVGIRIDYILEEFNHYIFNK